MSSKTGFQRVINIFLDKELEHEDLVNPLIVLGQLYDPISDLSQGQSHGIQETPINEAAVLVSSNEVENVNEQIPGLNIGDIRLKFQVNINSFFNLKKDDIAEEQDCRFPLDFLDDVNTRLWLTYRVSFPLIPKDKNSPLAVMGALMRGNFADIQSDGFSTDSGWGCMIRTGQCLLANCLLDIHLGRGWRYHAPDSKLDNELVHDKIVSWFVDDPSSAFSIHNFVKKGTLLSGKSSGEWFGPSAASRSIQALLEDYPDAGLKAYIGTDSGEIYENDIDFSDGKPVLLLLGLRLGIENVNSIYYSSLKNILTISQSVGIAGGRPSSSHYFFGYQGDYLFFLDPHVSHRPALKFAREYSLTESELKNDVTALTNSDLESVHTTSFNKLKISEMDPSMLIGLCIKNPEDWETFKRAVKDKGLDNIIHIVKGSKSDALLRKNSYDYLTEGHVVLVESENGEEDEFVDLGADLQGYAQDVAVKAKSTESQKDLGESHSTEDLTKDEKMASNKSGGELAKGNGKNNSFEDLDGVYSREAKYEDKVIFYEDEKDANSK